MKTNIIISTLLLCIAGCTSKENEPLTQQQKEQIKKEIKVVVDSIFARVEKLDVKWLDYYADSPDWGMLNADGSRWDYQTTKKAQPDFFNSVISYKWTTTHETFVFLTKDIVIYSLDGKDETILKSNDKLIANKPLNSLYGKGDTSLKLGDKIIYDPHAYTLVFKKIEGQWKVIYSHDSGIPVTQKADLK